METGEAKSAGNSAQSRPWIVPGHNLGKIIWIGVLPLLGVVGCGVAPDELLWLEHESSGHEPQATAPIDPRIDQECLKEQLTPFVDSIGAGWPSAYRPTGMVHVSAAGQILYSNGFGASDSFATAIPVTLCSVRSSNV